MIRVLILANDSLLAQFIESTISQERDLTVFRATRDELGERNNFSVVIIVDEKMAEDDLIRLRDFIRDDMALLLIKVSLNTRNVYVHENYQLVNPDMSQLIQVVREFTHNHLKDETGRDTGSQKKIVDDPYAQAAEMSRPQTVSLFGRSFDFSQARNFRQPLPERVRGSLSREIPFFFYSLFLHYLRLENPKNVTLPAWQDHSTRYPI